MKSRLINAQNQHVERISTSTLVIGIDIAKEKHDVQAINFQSLSFLRKKISAACSPLW
ncbi:hypothetical protein PAE9249_00001 [Paenibacillus sp. CECT 9249]|uniref:IS110 family transposase n=1 Tax=Paenibacillus sp. CECT 9249 TaxID=2845385 RepID=UPI001E5DEB58|nr:IS110 family transposase [Paenibacillus sp. CECT 9249]CAH0117545.1 hypothetical protein PAE9249_00001 [Paenibacillus sp. CECT 9249]